MGILTFLKNLRFRSKDGFETVLGLSRAPFECSWGALGGFLGGSWQLFGASRSTKEGLQIRLGIILGLVCSLLAAEDGLGSVDVVFSLLSEPLGMDFGLPN